MGEVEELAFRLASKPLIRIWALQAAENSPLRGFVLGHDFSRAAKSFILTPRADCSPRGTPFKDFFSSLF